MKSIRTRFMCSYLGATLLVFAVVSAVAVYYVHYSIEYHSAQALSFLASQKASEINDDLENIEHAVHVLKEWVLLKADTVRLMNDERYARTFRADLLENAMRLIQTIKSAKTFFFSLDLDTYKDPQCIYLLNTESDPAAKIGASHFLELSFDVRRYSSTDTTHVAWYYEPKAAQSPGWFGPHTNHNIEAAWDTIFYAVPIYKDGEFLGVIGMDMSVALLRTVIDNLDYEAGFGFLVGKSGNVLYHRNFPEGLSAAWFENFKDGLALRQFFSEEYIDTGKNYAYDWNGVRHRLILNSMHNGMLLAVSVPEHELLRLQSSMLARMFLLLITAMVLAMFLANNLAYKIIQPIQTITIAASHIARGELNTPVTVQSDDELGALADSIRKISLELKEYIAYISAQAYTDAMTGIRNKAAYLDKVKELDLRIGEHMASFTVFVFDVNGLKLMNDTLGHEAGDMLIKDAAGILKAVFVEDRIYRIGGDEFVVIDEHVTPEQVPGLIDAFERNLHAFNQDNDQYKAELGVSKGVAVFNEQTDGDYKTVFARADEAMYADKEAYYKTHEYQRRKSTHPNA